MFTLGGDFDLAIQATDFCGRSGLLRVCLHWVTVWAAGFEGRVPESFTEFGNFESLESGDQDGHSLFGGLLLSAQAKK